MNVLGQEGERWPLWTLYRVPSVGVPHTVKLRQWSPGMERVIREVTICEQKVRPTGDRLFVVPLGYTIESE